LKSKDFKVLFFEIRIYLIGKGKAKTFSPLNTDNTTNKAMAPTIIPYWQYD
jgi:hypothetical protein